ncbi:MAG: hypothetical protein IPM54_34850 [Polyangiaceae bacterium]|nr:hypothetical protein [Polyangiaceae bacterium]
MHIDRSRFLLLTASIAGGACSSSSASSSSGPVVVAAPIIALPAEGDGAPASSGASAPVKSSQTVMGSGDDDALAALDRPPSAADDDGGTCDEGGAPPTGCGTLRAPGPHCESFSDTKAMCGKLARGLRPRVAEQVVDCILAKSGKQSVCDFDLANQCGLVALQKACIEPSTQAACAPIVRACGGRLQMRECQALVSSVTSRNRRNMMTCITEGCSADYCLYQVE